MPNDRLAGKVAIITGGASGIGASIVQTFLSQGCKVIIWDLNSSLLDSLVGALSSNYSGNFYPFVGDVSQASDWNGALELAIGKFGSVDVLVNNAGVVHVSRASEEVDEDEVDRMWKINVKPLYYSARVMVPYWRKEGKKGVVVNLSSISAARPRPKLVWYAASKGAVTAATRGLAAEYAKDGIRVCCIQPVLAETAMVAPVLGGIDTPEARAGPLAGIPIGRIATPQDVANAACFLASDEASFLTGVCLDVDGGRSLM